MEKSTKVMSLRVPVDLASWAESYAEQRGVKRVVILETALVAFRELCGTGVPDLVVRGKGGSDSPPSSEAPKSEQAVRRARTVPTPEQVQASRDGASRLAELRAIAAGHAARAKAERERKYRERGW